MLVHTKRFYTPAYVSNIKNVINSKSDFLGNDEMLLYRLCNNTHGLPDPTDQYRDLHGLHLSLSRTKPTANIHTPLNRKMHWCPILTQEFYSFIENAPRQAVLMKKFSGAALEQYFTRLVGHVKRNLPHPYIDLR
jgi:hypothetical protein